MSEPLQIQPAVARGRFRKELWEDEEWTAEEKLDGVRYLWHHHGDHFHLTSRRVSVKTGQFVEKADNFPQLGVLLNLFPKGTVLDGELITPDRKSYSTISLSGSHPDRAISLQQACGWAKYVVFDLPRLAGDDLTSISLSYRKSKLHEGFLHNDFPNVELVLSSYLHRERFLEEIL